MSAVLIEPEGGRGLEPPLNLDRVKNNIEFVKSSCTIFMYFLDQSVI